MNASPSTVPDCCTTCTEPQSVNVPGPVAPPCEPCADGAAGVNAFATINGGGFIVPVYGASVTVALKAPAGSLWMAQLQNVFVQSYGHYQVVGIPDDTHATLLNLGYASNVQGDGVITFADGERVVPAGVAGTAGAAPSGVLLVANNLNDVASVAAARSNLGLGTMATQAAGAVAITGGSITGITDLAVADGGTGASTAAGARTNLGLGTMAVQDAGAVAITGGSAVLTGGSLTGVPVSGAAGSFTTLDASGVATLAGKLIYSPTAVQSIGAASTILADAAKVKVVGNGGPVTVGTLPTLSNGTADGQVVEVFGTNSTNTVTVQDEGTLPGSKLRLGATTRVLGHGYSLRLSWDAGDALWYECGYTALV